MFAAPPHTNLRTPVALLLGLALACSSCGRALPTAPSDGAAAGLGRTATPFRAQGSDDAAVVTLSPGASGDEISSDFGATLLAGSAPSFARLVPGAGETCDQLVGRLALDPRVVTVERDDVLETAETRQESYASDDGNGALQTYLEQPATAAIHLDPALSVSRGLGVTVAVLDTGVDPQHPALSGHLVAGYDFVDGDSSPIDTPDFLDNDGDGSVDEAFGHGTHVAGIVALTAPDARIMPIRVLDADGRGGVATVAAGIQYAIAHGARVLSLSLGMLHRSDGIQNMLDAAEERGIVVICSAGNWGAEHPTEYPASSSHASAIGATDASARPAPFTSYGNHLALCAPGVGVRSAYPGGGWRLWSGTSMSTPFVAGTAALLLAIHPRWSRDQVFFRIEGTARPLVGVPAIAVGKLGAGMLDAGAALQPDALPPDDGTNGSEDVTIRRP